VTNGQTLRLPFLLPAICASLIRAYAKVFQQGKAPKTVQPSTARRLNAAGAVLR